MIIIFELTEFIVLGNARISDWLNEWEHRVVGGILDASDFLIKSNRK